MIFSDEEIFAGTLLILEAMRSPNFATGVSGWSINKDGSAEFNNIVIRGGTTTQGLILMYNGTPAVGNLIGSIAGVSGTDSFGNAYGQGFNFGNQLAAHFQVDNTGTVNLANSANQNVIRLIPSRQAILLYSGSPALNNLNVSIAAAAGSDLPGNAFTKGIQIQNSGSIVVGGSGFPQVTIDSTTTAGIIRFPTNSQVEVDKPSILSGSVNSGSVTEYAKLVINGPSVSFASDWVWQQFNSQATNNSSAANIQWQLQPGAPAGAPPQLLMTLDKTNGLAVNGNVAATGSLSVGSGTVFNATGVATSYGNGFNAYTPTITGAGTATFSTQTGWWQRVGKMVFFNAVLITSAVGTGTAVVGISTPTPADHSIQQVVTGHIAGTAGVNGTVAGIVLTGGIDRIRSSTGANITGADLANGASAGANVNIQGWYREA